MDTTIEQCQNNYQIIEKWACDFSHEERQCATLSEEDTANDTEILYYDVTSEYPFVNS